MTSRRMTLVAIVVIPITVLATVLVMKVAGQSFNLGSGGEQFETQTAYALGGGIDYRALGNLWVRGDYEYQFWPDSFGTPSWYLDPHGITLGLAWEFKPRRRY